MSTTAPKPVTTPIPVQLSEPEFEAFILPHLSMPKRGTRLQGEWSRVERFSVKPGKVRVTTLKEARDGIDQDAKGRLAQLATGMAQR